MITQILKKSFTSLFLLGSAIVNGSPLKSDETVVFFPTAASLNEESQWEVPIHYWIFEKENQSALRKLTQKFVSEVAEGLDIPIEKANSETFKKRLMWFLVDNERNKLLNIVIDKNTLQSQDTLLIDTETSEILKHTLKISAANGHSKSIMFVPAALTNSKWINYRALGQGEGAQEYIGQSQLIPKKGFSVISDIDDTIKISEVLDKKALIRNTFLEEHQTTPNMPEFYRALEMQGAYFHYVSASPWQIYPSLKPFMDEHYPPGSYSLRNFRLTDSSLFSFLQSSKEYKLEQIRSILEKYPEHKFLLIGDSGEHDPVVYAQIYKEFPEQIARIMIRAVAGSNINPTHLNLVFSRVPNTSWKLFSEADQLHYP